MIAVDAAARRSGALLDSVADARPERPGGGDRGRRRSRRREAARGPDGERDRGSVGRPQPRPGRERGAAAASGEWLAVLLRRAPRSSSPTGSSSCTCTRRSPASPRRRRCSSRPDGRIEAAGWSRSPSTTRWCRCWTGSTPAADGYYGSLVCARDVSVLGVGLPARAPRGLRPDRRVRAELRHRLRGLRPLTQRLRARGHRLVYAPRPRVVLHETPAARRERARPRRPGAVRRPLVRRPRRGRPVLQPQLHPPRGELRAPHDRRHPTARADAAGDRLLRPVPRQQRDPGLPLRHRPDRRRGGR